MTYSAHQTSRKLHCIKCKAHIYMQSVCRADPFDCESHPCIDFNFASICAFIYCHFLSFYTIHIHRMDSDEGDEIDESSSLFNHKHTTHSLESTTAHFDHDLIADVVTADTSLDEYIGMFLTAYQSPLNPALTQKLIAVLRNDPSFILKVGFTPATVS